MIHRTRDFVTAAWPVREILIHALECYPEPLVFPLIHLLFFGYPLL